MNITVKLDGLKEAIDSLNPNKFKAAVSSALNKTATHAKTVASRKIREEYNLPATQLSQKLRLSARANGNKLEATITGTGKGLALSKFGAKQEGVTITKKKLRYNRKATKGKKGNRYGGAVSVEVKRGNRKRVSGNPLPFVAQMGTGGHIGIFVRESKNRLPIKELMGPGTATLFGSKKVMDALEKAVDEKFQSTLDHELEFQLKK